MTRPRAAAERFVAEMPDDLRAQVSPLFSPLLTIVPVADGQTIAADEAAIFTSSNGVANAPAGAGRLAYCIGTATTDRATQHGWSAQMAGLTADELVAGLTKNRISHNLVHIRGQHTRGDVVTRLRSAGTQVRDCIVYDQVPQLLSSAAHEALMREELTIVPLFSPRTAMQFAKQAPRATSMHVIAFSDAVATAAEPIRVDSLAVRPDATAMYEAIRRAICAG
ncbi:uroporphyrinogen-III synthase [uncultured Tateyamaria sp.]|uniref:uroporphyrinogen-III synthase n=1 Tax=uncultured Tateyamaria sp. TaxID=455651 RepID=UPI002616E18B|nr:uroporphyrinogen-III synthase [uncultured Tateyamaria sp.]